MYVLSPIFHLKFRTLNKSIVLEKLLSYISFIDSFHAQYWHHCSFPQMTNHWNNANCCPPRVGYTVYPL
jgi:hypothetical protein